MSGVGVLTVHHDEDARRVTRGVVNATPGFEEVGAAGSAEEALDLAVTVRPGLALVAAEMPGIDGLETSRRLLGAVPGRWCASCTPPPSRTPTPWRDPGRLPFCTWMPSRDPRCKTSGTSTGRGRVGCSRLRKDSHPRLDPNTPPVRLGVEAAAAPRSPRTGDRWSAHTDLGPRGLGKDRAAPHVDGRRRRPRCHRSPGADSRALRAARLLARRARGDVAGAARAHGAGGSCPRLAHARWAARRARPHRRSADCRARRLPGGRHGRCRSPMWSRCSSGRIPRFGSCWPRAATRRFGCSGCGSRVDWSRSAPRTSRSRADETSELLRPLELAPADVETLWSRTEGWVAALRLAELSLQAHPGPERVHRRLRRRRPRRDRLPDLRGPERLRRRTTLRVPAPDVDRRAGQRRAGRGADRRLRRPARTRRARARGRVRRPRSTRRARGSATTRCWREVLRAELRHRFPDELPALHSAAGRWYAANGQPLEGAAPRGGGARTGSSRPT